jgi:hypothetical protein
MASRGKRLSNSFDRAGIISALYSGLGVISLTFFPSYSTTALLGGRREFIQAYRLGTTSTRPHAIDITVRGTGSATCAT